MSASLVAAEGDHEAEGADHEPGAKRLQVDDPAPHEHQAADRDEHERDHVRGNAEGAVEPVDDRSSRRAAVPAEPEQGGEEETDRDHAEPPELGVVVRSGLAGLRRRFLTRAGVRGFGARLAGFFLVTAMGLAASAAASRLLRGGPARDRARPSRARVS